MLLHSFSSPGGIRSLNRVSVRIFGRVMSSKASEGDEMSARDIWLTDTQALAQWLDVSVVKRGGRAHKNKYGEFAADVELLSREESMKFPHLEMTNLDSEPTVLPLLSPIGEPTLLCFSFRQYGSTLTKSWSAPFLEKTGGRCVDMFFVEYGFLSFAQGMYIQSLRGQVPAERHADTVVKFGGIKDFAADLLLPNKYSGYAYLVDGEGYVRWRGSGAAREDEIDALVRATRALRDGE